MITIIKASNILHIPAAFVLEGSVFRKVKFGFTQNHANHRANRWIQRNL